MKKKILVVFIILILLGIITFSVAYNRLKNSMSPIFCISGGLYVDKVCVYRIGLGYTVMYVGEYEELDRTIKNKNSIKPWFSKKDINFE